MEAGESPEKCLAREIREELQIRILVEKIFHVVNHRMDNFSILLLCYFCTWEAGRIRLSDHDRIAWLAPVEMRNYPLTAADREVVEELIRDDSC